MNYLQTIAQASVAAAAEVSSMKGRLASCTALVVARVVRASAHVDPELLQLPGGSLIATLLWLFAKGAVVLRRH